MSSPQISQSARLGKIRTADKSRIPRFQINGKNNIFDDCTLEQQLHEFVRAKNMLGLTAMDGELQEEACRIIGRQEEMSSHPVDDVANWLVRLICSSPGWLAPFRQRASLPRSEDMDDENLRSKDPSTIDSTIYNYSRLEVELAEYVKQQRSMGIEPTDADLQRQGRIIIYEFDDAWNQTAADNEQWLAAFRQRHVNNAAPPAATSSDFSTLNSPTTLESVPPQIHGAFTSLDSNNMNSGSPPTSTEQQQQQQQHNSPKIGQYFINDANCYRRLARELTRWIKSVTSLNNPNRHVPTDGEIQHQARWILYDDDDPWNQTAADNAEWLRRFKRDVGILTDDGPGLPQTDAWAVSLGGSGFAPPYVFPKSSAVVAPYQPDSRVPVCLGEGTKPFEAQAKTANKFLETLCTQFPPLPKVFCPRELENGLLEYVQGEFVMNRGFPSDEELKERAKLILGTEDTPADDQVLLERFKEMAKAQVTGQGVEQGGSATLHSGGAQQPSIANTGHDGLGDGLGDIMTGIEQQQQLQPHHAPEADGIRINITESELDEMLKDMSFEYDSQAADLAASAGLGLDQMPSS